jgi:alcohol dehydrogenase class IV
VRSDADSPIAFDFATATRIVFGWGARSQLPKLISGWGARAFVLAGSRRDAVAEIEAACEAAGFEVVRATVRGEPTTDSVREAVEYARGESCDLVIGIGGGSVIDAAKAVAALLRNTGPLEDYLEVIGRGVPLTEPSAPCVAVPTTSGTGAEVTRNSVLRSPEHAVKVSLRSHHLLPALALVDPELTVSMPPPVTAASGMDALTQLIESLTTPLATPITDALCRDGIARGAHALPRAYADGSDRSAREDMALVSLYGGIALANAKLGAVHGLAGPLGGMFDAPHGALCAALLPHVMRANISALDRKDPGSAALTRYDEVARLVTGSAHARRPDAASWAEDLCRTLAVPSLTDLGVSLDAAPDVAAKAARSSSMKGNPVALEAGEIEEVLRAAGMVNVE